MLDTVVLTLNHSQFSISRPDEFTPSATVVIDPQTRLGARGYIGCHRNPTTQEIKAGTYQPRVSLTKRYVQGGVSITMRVEFSAPKLLYRNNFDELVDQDFSAICEILQQKLLSMGINVALDVLAIAEVSSIHFSKNIPLDDYLTSRMVIGELGKINLNEKLDLSRTSFRDGGSAIHYHANSWELVFYDKVKDLQKSKVSEKRSIDKNNNCQLWLLKQLNRKKPFEVLRMEVRFGSKKKLKSIIQKLSVKRDIFFKEVFDSALSKRILQDYWGQISDNLRIPLKTPRTPEDIFLAVRKTLGREKTPGRILQYMAALMIVDSVGLHGLRALHAVSGNRGWYRLKADLDKLDLPDNQKYTAIKNITHCLAEFKPVHLPGCGLE